MAYIIIDDTSRITAASKTHHCGDNEIVVDIPQEVWEAGIHNYKYEDGEWIYDPIPEPDQPEPEEDVSVWDELDAAYQKGVDSV